MSKFNRLVNWGLTPICLLTALLLSACAGIVPDPNHGFDFRPLRDSPTIRVLDWRYGVLQPVTPVRSTNPDGAVGAGTRGRYPVGDHIYLKWQVPPSPEIFERKIELKGLLPFSMEGNEILVMFRKNEPHVYVISRDPNRPCQGDSCVVKISSDTEEYSRGYLNGVIKQIYPPIGK